MQTGKRIVESDQSSTRGLASAASPADDAPRTKSANFQSSHRHAPPALPVRRIPALVPVLWLFASVSLLSAASPSPTPAKLSAPISPKTAAALEFSEAQLSWQKNPTNPAAVIRFARATFNHANLQSKNSDKAEAAQAGINACRKALETNPTDAGLHYLLGMNLGRLAETKSLGALRIVREMEELFHRARALSPTWDHAGPDRSLGLLYQQAPRWPTSIGNKNRARQHFERAIELKPDYPGNRLAYAEALAQWKNRDEALTQLDALNALWERAKAALNGPEWTSDWEEWASRKTRLEAELATARPPSKVGVPQPLTPPE